MRTLALDMGDKRIGVAVSDASGVVATPLKVIDATDFARAKREFRDLIEEYEIEQILIGLPLSLNGEEGPQARHVRALVEKFCSDVLLPKFYYDERLTSHQAKQSLGQSGISERKSRGRVDMIAASIFLQAWLDSQQPKEF